MPGSKKTAAIPLFSLVVLKKDRRKASFQTALKNFYQNWFVNYSFIAGNEYETEAMTGRYDASYGLVLMGDGKGKFNPVNSAKSGFIIDGDVKDMQFLNIKNKGKVVIAAVNNDKLKCLFLNSKKL